MEKFYRAHEFAVLAGVTVRTLHHYDRVGVLKPKRSSSGYRLYNLADLERLEQIAALKFLGIPLKQVRVLLECNPLTLLESLRLQLRALTEKRELLDRAIHAIGEAERLVRSNQPANASVLRRIIEVIEMQPEKDFMRKYYTEEGWTKRTLMIEQAAASSEERREARKQLFHEVEAALDLDPASEAAQILARRWVLLSESVTGGDPEIRAGAISAWKDHKNWPQAEQDALLARYGLDASNSRELSMMRIEKVAHFIGQAIGRKFYGALPAIFHALLNKPSQPKQSKRWAQLFQDVESALGEDAASNRAQALADRWNKLKQDTETNADKTLPIDGFRQVLRQQMPKDTPTVALTQVVRLYRIEQVLQFLQAASAEKKRP